MAPEPREVVLREYQTRCGLELNPVQANALRERFSKQLTITRAFDGRGYDVTAGGTVGVIVLPDLVLRIEPKAPVANLFHMLAVAYGLDVRLQAEQTTLEAGDSLLEFTAKVFVGQVDQIARQGIARGYVDIEEEAAYVRGRLLLAEQARRAAVVPTRFHQRANEFTADLRENRILRATLALLLRHYYRKATLPGLLRRALTAFSEVTPVAAGPADCDRVVYTRLNGRYRPAIGLARLLLQFLSPEGRAGHTRFPAFLVPMHDVFEKFVAALLRERWAGHPLLAVHAQAGHWLDHGHRLLGKPDLVIDVDNQPRLVVDTKYKRYPRDKAGLPDTPAGADLYQMLAYCHTLGIGRALLLYPEALAATDFAFRSGVTVTAAGVALDGSLDAFRARWAAWGEGVAGMAGLQGVQPGGGCGPF